mgnify:CR=1 FL=1
MSLTRSNEVSDSPLQRKSSSILLLFRGKGVLRLCRTTTAITGHPVFFNEEKAQGVFFLPQSIDASHLVRETATLNEHESPSIHWGVQVIRRSPRPLQKTALQSPMFPGDAESGAKRNKQRGSPRVHPPDPVGSGGWPEGDPREPSLFNLTC